MATIILLLIITGGICIGSIVYTIQKKSRSLKSFCRLLKNTLCHLLLVLCLLFLLSEEKYSFSDGDSSDYTLKIDIHIRQLGLHPFSLSGENLTSNFKKLFMGEEITQPALHFKRINAFR